MSKDKDSINFTAVDLAWDLGFTVIIPIIAFILLGRYLDEKFNTAPVFILIGIILGVFLSSYGAYRMTMKVINKSKRSEEKEMDGSKDNQKS